MAKEAQSKAIVILTTDEIGKEATNLAKSLANSDTRVQRYLVSEIAHIEEHRNPTRLNTFFNSLATSKSGARVNAMHAFIQAFANVKYDGRKNGYVMQPARDKAEADVALRNAMSTKWTTFKPEAAPRQFDAEGAAKQFLTRMFNEGFSFEEIETTLEEVKYEAIADVKEKLSKAQKAAADLAKRTANLERLEHVAASIETPEDASEGMEQA